MAVLSLFSTFNFIIFQESIIDASEDSQLEAAIAASLKETLTEPCTTKSADRDSQIGDTADDSLTEFTESESESENVSKTFLEDEKNILENKVFESNANKTEYEKNSNNGNDDNTSESYANRKPGCKDMTRQKEEDNLEDSGEDNVGEGENTLSVSQ